MREAVDAEVVPVEHETEVLEAESPGGVLGLVSGACGMAALTFEGEDLDVACTPARSRAIASPAAAGVPWPLGPVLNLKNIVLPSNSA